MAETSIAVPTSTGKKRSYDAAFKLKVVESAIQTSNRAAATKFFVDEKWFRVWRKQKASLQALPDKQRRISGGGRKAKHPEVED